MPPPGPPMTNRANPARMKLAAERDDDVGHARRRDHEPGERGQGDGDGEHGDAEQRGRCRVPDPPSTAPTGSWRTPSSPRPRGRCRRRSTITPWAMARKASGIVPAVIVRISNPPKSGSCETRHSRRSTSSIGDAHGPALADGRTATAALVGSRQLRRRPPNELEAYDVMRRPLQPVGRRQQRALTGVGGQLGDDPAVVQHGRAVADHRHLAQLAREHDDRRALVGQRPDEVVDLVLGADVDAAGRVEQQHHPQAGGQPASDRHLLLVAAGEAADLARRPRVDRQAVDRLADPAALLAPADRPPPGDVG